ncbi:hypothetical protein ACFY93_28535 [Streptomyces sp. NPDC008313]|uniref:hypothetical protein n=1 Tax=Streptomyces sp. NPDC008313 TaxID=3364826 RepID=UPI0036E0C08E
MIAVVGHRDLTEWTLGRIEEELRTRLARFAEAGSTGLVRVGQGLPVAAGRAARKAGLALMTVLPDGGRLPALSRPGGARAAGELLLLSQRVRWEEYDPADRDACVRLDERLLRGCARVLAVWDGSPSDGRDATAHLVAFARSLGIEVEVLWPDGAERTAGATPSAAARAVP